MPSNFLRKLPDGSVKGNRKFLIVLLLCGIAAVIVLGFLGAKEYAFIGKRFHAGEREREGASQPDPVKQKEETVEAVRTIASQIRQFSGTISQIVSPKGNEARFLTIDAFVMDQDRLTEIDTSDASGSQEIPTKKEQIEVIADAKTEIQGGSLESLSAGDFVSVETMEPVGSVPQVPAKTIVVVKGSSAGRK